MDKIAPEKMLDNKDIIVPLLDEVHIWFVNIDSLNLNLSTSMNSLPSEIKKQLQSIRTTYKKEISIKRNYILLKILSYYLQRDISRIEINYTEFGKPFIPQSEFKFNVSNSFNYLLVGISQNNEIGVDIEKIRNNIDYTKLVTRYFTENEKKAFNNFNEKIRKEIFFEWWTIKESLIKATGLGMHLPLNSFEVPLNADEPVIQIKYHSIQHRYHYRKLLLSDDLKSSICLTKAVNKIKFYTFHD